MVSKYDGAWNNTLLKNENRDGDTLQDRPRPQISTNFQDRPRPQIFSPNFQDRPRPQISFFIIFIM